MSFHVILEQWHFHEILVAMATDCLIYHMTIFHKKAKILAH